MVRNTKSAKSSKGSAPVQSTKASITRCRYPGCPYTSTRTSDLKRHFSVHLDGPGQFKCPFPGCHHTSKQRSNLKPHLAIHTGNRPDKCPDQWIDEYGVVSRCTAAFSDPSGLLRHRKRRHDYKVGNRGTLAPKFRSAADQEADSELNALALELKITVSEAARELKKRRMAGYYGRSSTSSASSSNVDPATPEPVYEPVASSSTSSHIQNALPMKHERSPTPSFDALAADMGLHLDSSSFLCSFDDAPQLAASDVNDWQQQQQQILGQNFGGAMDATDFLLSNLDPQFLNAPVDWSFTGAPEAASAPQPAIDWNMQNWAQSFVAPPMDPPMGSDMGLGMGMGMGAPNPLAYNTPSVSSADPLYGQTMPSWDHSYYDGFSTDGSSITSSPSVHGLDYLDDFLRRTA
ncbi:hypothetical protein TRAPUB_3178 [Trametes pubescens]|uniref:C2H2-type domain-containing protein n=1 Tax=Trametes pubescens TaxID=154538 RepID=A0A1M2VEB4_TRAPU|nr:hypothetical protein TRAPUB_3178 [Trametes pubescens]